MCWSQKNICRIFKRDYLEAFILRAYKVSINFSHLTLRLNKPLYPLRTLYIDERSSFFLAENWRNDWKNHEHLSKEVWPAADGLFIFPQFAFIPVYYTRLSVQAGQSSDFLHSACWWPCPQSPVMQSKLCGCEEFLRHSSVELAPKNEKKPYGYHANLRL